MNKVSAGLLMYNIVDGVLRVFLVHPGGPMWANRDVGAWSIPKGEVEATDADNLKTAVREFTEETGFVLPSTVSFTTLGNVIQKSGKVVYAWAFEGTYDPATLKCNEIEISHPRGSTNMITIPEVDRGGYFTIEDAEVKINPTQKDFLHRLQEDLDISPKINILTLT